MIITSENIKTIINALIENIDYKLKAINKTINKNTKKANNAQSAANNAQSTANTKVDKTYVDTAIAAAITSVLKGAS